MKRKKKYVVSCIAKEFNFLWAYYWVAAFFVFGFLIYRSIHSNGAVLGLSNIRNTAQLEKFFTYSDSTGRLHADWIAETGLQVDLTGTDDRRFSFQVGGAYVETPPVTFSTYKKTYDIYIATLEDNVVVVLFGDIFKKDWAGLQYCDVIEIYSDDIGGKQYLIDGLKENYPDFFRKYNHVYVAKGDYPSDFLRPVAVILLVFLLLAAVLFTLPRFYPIQKFSHLGRQITKFAKAEGRTFKEMCERLNEYGDRAFYRNGLEVLSERYVVTRERGKIVAQTQERMNIFSLSGTYGVPYIQRITIVDGDYPDEMNDIHIVTDTGKRYGMTIHRTRQEVEEILAQMGIS